MNIPSRVLQTHRLEILITSINTGSAPLAADAAGLVESMLVPPLQTPVASTGRAGFVRYPVHKAIVVGEGVEGCIDFGRLSAAVESTALIQSGVKEKLIQVALNVPRDAVPQPSAEGLISAVDIQQAALALSIFRQDVANGALFNTKWQASNIESIKKSLTSDTSTASILHPALEHHILSTLDSTATAISTTETLAHATQQRNTIPESTRATLQSAISTWSQHAHTDLQISLARALASRSWRRTSWSRLLWRVDDVGVAAESVLRNHWLLDAEAGLAFLAGRVEQAGFFASGKGNANFNPDYALHKADRVLDRAGNEVAAERLYVTGPETTTPPSSPTSTPQKGIFSSLFTKTVPALKPADLLHTTAVLDQITTTSGINILHTRPWPLAIHFTRQKLLHTLVPSLQSRAQILLLSFLSTAGASTALGVWIWVATAGAGLMEAGAVGALGTVLAMRRLQTAWERAREQWEGGVGEEGRLVLAEVEEVMRGVVRGNERAGLRESDVRGWREARDAVRVVEEALEKRREEVK